MTRLSLLATLLPAATLLAACDPAVEGPDDPMDREFADSLDDVEGEDGDDGDDSDDSVENPRTEPPQPEPEPKPEAAQPCEPNVWDGYACEMDDGTEGSNFCLLVDGEEVWTACTDEFQECYPGDGIDMGCMGSICAWDPEAEALYTYSWAEDDCNTPLVLNFEKGPVEFSPVAAASFDLSTDGTCMSTAWPTAPWLALDRDGDGMIRSGAELFGSATPMASGVPAKHGFAALAELDSNGDGKISAADERFGELVLWNDFDEDRIGAYGELQPLSQSKLVSIDLQFNVHNRCDNSGNCGSERAAFEFQAADGSPQFGQVVDVHLACQ